MNKRIKITFLFLIMILTSKTRTFANDSSVYNIGITFGVASQSERIVTWNTKDVFIKTLDLIMENGEKIQYNSEIIKKDAYNEYYKDKNEFYSESNQGSFFSHKVYLKDLDIGEYVCVIGNKEVKLTIDNNKDDFSFLYFTDPQAYSINDFKTWKVTSDLAIKRFPNTSFFTISGDLVDRGSSERLWNNFFEYGNNIFSNYTIAPVIGNHETDTGPNTFIEHFGFSKNVNENLPEYVYSFEYENAYFSILTTEMTYGQLNSKDEKIRDYGNKLIDEQLRQLRQNVKAKDKKWNFVIFHKGLNPSGAYYDDATVKILKERFIPVFDELGIDVVLQGHDHTYSMAYWYNGEKVSYATEVAGVVNKTDDTPGTLYLIGNSAGTKYYNIAKNVKFNYLAVQPKKPIYTNIKVTNEKLIIDSYTVMDEKTDKLFVTLTINK